MKVALITGITGQDGSHLAELLLGKGYQVHGLVRRASSFSMDRIKHLYEVDPNLTLHYGDMTDGTGLRRMVDRIRPQEVYNLACQSHVKVSFDAPEYSVDAGAMGTLRILEAIRDVPDVRFYQASSSEMYGSTPPPQNEETPFHPRSPYACGKLFSYWQTVNYRESYGMFACNGILFNHEGPRRGETFVTRKITRAAARIKLGLQGKLVLGNLDAYRDWGYAGDYVEAMWRMLQASSATDYVVGTGESHSVREFATLAFARVGLVAEEHIETNARYERPAEVDHLRADASKIERELGWTPATSFQGLVEMMVDNDLALAQQEKVLAEAGFKVGSRGASSGYVPF